MNKRFFSVVAFAFITAAVASFLLYRFLTGKLSAPPPPANTVLVAAHHLQTGALIKELDFQKAAWPGVVPKGAALKPEDLVGRGVISDINEGELIFESRLAPKGAGAGLAATIPVGMRAVAVKVNEVVGVAGFVVPGMRVDVIVMGNAPNSNTQGTITKTVLQNLQVISAGQQIEKDAEGKPISVSVVNLLVTPEQAETLSLASNETRIQLVLRNPLDTEQAKTTGITTASLFSGQNPAPVSHPRPRPIAPPKPVVPEQPVIIPVRVEVYAGAVKSEAVFKPTSESNK
jgi:pilus assembly protein CpaB